MHQSATVGLLTTALALALGAEAGAGQAANAPEPASVRSVAAPSASGATAGASVPKGYVIGPEDVLAIVFWKDKDMSADVVVRPDGKVSLPLLNDVQAAGLTPEELREQLSRAASKYVEDPVPSVIVKEIHSRSVFITGNVAKPGTFPLATDMNVVQLIALAGGLQEYANSKNIMVLRKKSGRQESFKFNYDDFVKQKNVEKNITLQPGDTVIVP